MFFNLCVASKLALDRLAHTFGKVLDGPDQYESGDTTSTLTSTLCSFNPAIEIRPSLVR